MGRVGSGCLAKGKGVPVTFSAVRGQNEISDGKFGHCLKDGEIQAGSKSFFLNR